MATDNEKSQLVDELIREFRVSGSQDAAFDALAARAIGVNDTDLACLNLIENSGGLTAGELAAQSGLTGGAVTGVIDRLERVGYARRVADPADRRRVRLEVTPEWYRQGERIWGPMAAEWYATLTDRFSAEELRLITAFLRATNDVGRRHLERLREMA